MRYYELTELLGLLEHPDGYKRESAARRLGVLGDPVAIPKLITRVNDWVPQVRSAAKKSLSQMLVSKNAHCFADSLAEVLHLELCGRENHAEFISQVITFLVQPRNKHVLNSAILSDRPKVARIAAKLALENFNEDRENIIFSCLKHTDPIVRDVSANYFRYLSEASLPAVLDIAITDSFMPVRREAFQIYQRTDQAKGTLIAKSFLFDRHISIRELSIISLQKTGFDVKYIYANSLKDQNASILHRKCSILGLAYLKAEEEVQNIKYFLSDEAPSIRRSALQALEKLHGSEFRMIYVAHLSDESPSVAKESSRLISKLKLAFQSTEIIEHIPKHPPSHTFALAMRAMRASNKWERIIFLLNTINKTPKNSVIKNQSLLSELNSWNADFNRTFSQPTTQQIEEIKREYSACSHRLESHQKRSIEFTLKTINVI